MKKTILLLLSFVSISISSKAQLAETDNYGSLKIAPQSTDYSELLQKFQTDNIQGAYEKFKNEFIDLPSQGMSVTGKSDPAMAELYEKRLKMMATEIQLPYNDIVGNYIRLYTKQGGVMENILGTAQYYFPLFEEALFRHGLPMEFKILPIIESALIPNAKSSASAVGLWQMMLPTGKYYGLEVTSFVDERCDPVKSTEAACKYLKDLYRMYGDWTLVLAAYNCGQGNVNKAIKRAGGSARSYWDIWEHLPRETRSYVPAFIGASYGYTFHKAHNLNVRTPAFPTAVDTVMVNKMMHLEQVSSTLGVSVDVLKTLNPQYRIDIIPAIEERYPLILPTQLVGQFIDSESEIYAKDTTYLKKYLSIENLSTSKADQVAVKSSPSRDKKVVYKVKSGDFLGKIATKYKVKVADIQKWNKMKSTNIKPGQQLTIYSK